MPKHKIPGLGLRTIKTALAVSVCLLLSLIVDRSGALKSFYIATAPFYACTAAIICMQDSVEASFTSGLYRLFGTGIGGLIGILLLYLKNGDVVRIFLAFFGISSCIALCNIFKIRKASAIACIVFIIILFSSSDSPFAYAITRIVETAIGIIIAIIINKVIPSRNLFTLEHDSEQPFWAIRKKKETESSDVDDVLEIQDNDVNIQN